MIQQKLELPGIERIRNRFLEMLKDRQYAIAEHALIAWESDELDEINSNLDNARTVLHQIAGTAGSLGFKDLGTQARACEIEIDAHLNGPDADLAICPSPLIFLIDQFVQESEALIAANPQSVNA
ncbi:phosphorelay protein [Sulfitobacter sp.]|uniref:phosphorelay protein n=1 Tax=Sulfitobacter sp. TaxID=1903071 RepID=UPI003569181B